MNGIPEDPFAPASPDASCDEAMSEEEAILALHAALAPRLAQLEAGDLVAATPDDIVREAKRRDAIA